MRIIQEKRRASRESIDPMPRVSIIIPCHNAAPWIEETIRSALAQTHANREIIVIDDGSTDDSLRRARSFERLGVRVVTQRNAGASAARNHGLRLATGDFIQFLDADDLLAEDKIQRQVEALTAERETCIASCPWGRFETDPRSAKFVEEPNWRLPDPISWLCHNFAGRGMMPPVAWLTPVALLHRAGAWDERLSLNDDGEYFCRALLASKKILFCPDARAYYRSNLETSLSRQASRRAWESALLSHDLCTRHLLAAEASPKTRRACADLFQRLVFAIHPKHPDIMKICDGRIRSLGGSELKPGGGIIFRTVASVGGWRFARRLQYGAQLAWRKNQNQRSL